VRARGFTRGAAARTSVSGSHASSSSDQCSSADALPQASSIAGGGRCRVVAGQYSACHHEVGPPAVVAHAGVWGEQSALRKEHAREGSGMVGETKVRVHAALRFTRAATHSSTRLAATAAQLLPAAATRCRPSAAPRIIATSPACGCAAGHAHVVRLPHVHLAARGRRGMAAPTRSV
jgi:hypothetical protein